ncbi:MAG: hypothetical protein FWG63_06475 [Defluviitaleaceae bacterium]|nr:hypothetical protein [Defluviitaleaceae bacterium]
MTKKYDQHVETLKAEIMRSTQSHENWLKYLDCASRNPKYSFEEQLLIEEQKPNATAVADYEFWTKKAKRIVRKSNARNNYKTSIQIPATDSNGRFYIKNYFDIADTIETPNSIAIPRWQVTEDKHRAISEKLLDVYGFDDSVSDDFHRAVASVVTTLTEELTSNNLEKLERLYPTSALAPLGREKSNAVFQNVVCASVGTIINKRLGIDNENNVAYADTITQHIQQFNTSELVETLGGAVSGLSEKILREVEVAVRAYDREQQKQQPQILEEQENGENKSIHSTRNKGDTVLRTEGPTGISRDGTENESRGHDIQQPDDKQYADMDDDGLDRQQRSGESLPVPEHHISQSAEIGVLGEEASTVFGGTQQVRVQQAGLSGSFASLQGDGEPSGEALRTHDGRSEEESGEQVNKQRQESRSYGVGGTDEQLETQDTRNDIRRPNLQLVEENNEPIEKAPGQGAFSISKEDELFDWDKTVQEITNDTDNYTEPFVVIEFMEGGADRAFNRMDRLTFKEADQKFKEVEAAFRADSKNEGNYDKTYGAVFYKENPDDTELSVYGFRYDVGDYGEKRSGLYNHINNNYWRHIEERKAVMPDTYSYISDEDIAGTKKMLSVLADYIDVVPNNEELADIYQDEQLETQDTRNNLQRPDLQLDRGEVQQESQIDQASQEKSPIELGTFSISDLEIKEATIGTDTDREERIMTANYNGNSMAILSYVTFEGNPQITNIVVLEEYRRKGVATAMVQNLANNFPNKEIKWGTLTSDGAALKKSITYTEENEEYTKIQERLTEIDEELEDLETDYYENEYSEEEETTEKINALNEEIKELEERLYYLEPTKTFIKPIDLETSLPQESKLDDVIEVESTNFRMDSIDYRSIAEGGPKAKFKRNVEAIRTLKEIEAEKRKATPDEQKKLAMYVGWGGVSEAFSELNSQWREEYDELKELLTPTEYETARSSVLTAYYTDPTIINAMWTKIEELGGYKDYGDNLQHVNILEPSMGVGNFLGAMPEHVGSSANVQGVEIDSISGRIGRLLYPQATVQVTGFEKTFFDDEQFDVVIGNVPFSESIKPVDWRYDTKKESDALLIHDYFFSATRSHITVIPRSKI